jgi:nitrogen PTS system EIIA component
MKKISDLLSPEDILLDLEVSSKAQLIAEIGRHMERAHAMPQESVALSLSHREQIESTGLGEGVAIPHARVKALDRIRVSYARPKSPIPFEAPDGKLVSDILVLLVPKQPTEEHVRILAEATKKLSDRRFRKQLRRCNQSLEVKRLFDTWPNTRLGQRTSCLISALARLRVLMAKQLSEWPAASLRVRRAQHTGPRTAHDLSERDNTELFGRYFGLLVPLGRRDR